MRLVHRFLCWFPLWALATILAVIAILVGAAQVWSPAKAWDEAQWDGARHLMSEPVFWLYAAIVAALWSFFTWLTWPNRKRAPAADMTPYEVAHYLADESEWGRRLRLVREPFEHFGQPAVMRREPLIEAPAEISSRASQSGTLIRAFGRRSDSSVAEPIPHTFWISNGISPFATDNPGISLTAPMAGNHDAAPVIYRDLRFERAGVVATWPRMAWWRRAMRRLHLSGRPTMLAPPPSLSAPSPAPADCHDSSDPAQGENEQPSSDEATENPLKALYRNYYGWSMDEEAFEAAWEKVRRDAMRSAKGVIGHWEEIDPLRLYQAACLWVEKPPPESSDSSLPIEATPWLHKLKDAVAKKALPIDDDPRVG